VTSAVSPQSTPPLPTLPNYADFPIVSVAGAYTADGRYVASGGYDDSGSSVDIWPSVGGTPLRSFTLTGTMLSDGLAFTSDSSRLYAITGDEVQDANPVLHVRDYPTAPKAPWAWGWNGVGQLGNSNLPNSNLPNSSSATSVAAGVVAVAAGWYHNLSVASNGTVWAWGWNEYGQLGDGTTVNRPRPVPVPGVSGIVAVSGGYTHSLALAGDGTVWAWGANEYGQLGDATTVSSRVPVRVAGLTNVVAIRASPRAAITPSPSPSARAICGHGETTPRASWGTARPPTATSPYRCPAFTLPARLREAWSTHSSSKTGWSTDGARTSRASWQSGKDAGFRGLGGRFPGAPAATEITGLDRPLAATRTAFFLEVVLSGRILTFEWAGGGMLFRAARQTVVRVDTAEQNASQRPAAGRRPDDPDGSPAA
jgi:hypothetical protein